MTTSGKSSPVSKGLFFFLLILSMAFWGGAWTSAKAISGIVSVQTVVLYRFILAAAAIIPFVFLYKQRFRLGFKELVWPLIGAALFTAYNQLFFTGINLGLAGAGGVLVTTTNPIFTYILCIFLFRYRMSLRSGIGLFLGFVGGVIMLRLWVFKADEIFKLGNGLFLISSVVWAAVTVLNGKAQKRIHFITYTFWFYLFSAVYSIPFSLVKGDIGSVFHQNAFFWLNLLYLSFFAMAFSATIYFLASGRLGSHRASNFVFLVPLFAVLFSFIFLREVPTWNTIVGGSLALVAVYILNREKSKAAKQPGKSL